MDVALRSFSTEQRQKLADKGYALPDGSFPIVNRDDLENAIRAIGRASNPAAAKRHIIKRAKALGLTNLLPEDWRTAKLSAAQIAELTYKSTADLPSAVKDAYKSDCQSVFMRVFNKALADGKPESQAFAFAHTAAKNCMM